MRHYRVVGAVLLPHCAALCEVRCGLQGTTEAARQRWEMDHVDGIMLCAQTNKLLPHARLGCAMGERYPVA